MARPAPPPRAPFLSALSASPIRASSILRSFAAISSALYLLGADDTVADALCFAASSRGSSTSYASAAAACFVGAYGVYPSLSIGRVRKSGGLSTRSNRSSADGRSVAGLLSGGGSGPNATGAAATIAAAASSESEAESLESLRDGRFSSSLPYASSPKKAIVVTRLT